MDKTFKVRDEKLAWFKGQMAKLQKRAAKLGVDAPQFAVGECHDEVVQVRNAFEDEESAARLTGAQAFHDEIIRRWDVTISGEAPKYAGWTLAATLQHLEGGETLIRSIVEEDAPHKYRNAKSDCEHCQTYRRRNDTFLVRSEQGEWKQVGRNCIRDFLGHTSPETFARIAEVFAEALGLGDEGELGGGGRIDPRLPLLAVLTATMASIRAKGWVSRSAAKAYSEAAGGEAAKEATANHVWRMYFPSKDSAKDQREAREFFAEKINEKDAEVAQAAVDWVLGLDGELNDYLHNCRAIARTGAVEYRTAGYACSIIGAYNRELAKINERKDLPPSNYVGEVGKRWKTPVRVTVRGVKHFQNDWGATHLYLMNDESGNDIVWWASSEELEEGGIYDIIATVKKHEERQGRNDKFPARKQTVVSRVALFVDKPKKNAANKKIAQGLVDMMVGFVGHALIAESLVNFMTGLGSFAESYYQMVGWGLERFLQVLHDNKRAYDYAWIHAIRDFVKEAGCYQAHMAEHIGGTVALFCCWAISESASGSWYGVHTDAVRSFRRYKSLPGYWRELVPSQVRDAY